nr:P-type conjugative transfer protein TrbG [Caulobacter sp. RHG1]
MLILVTIDGSPQADGPKPPPRAPTALAGDPTQETLTSAALAARVEPRSDSFLGAIQRYAWTQGALYQVYVAPGQVTDIALEPGEQLAGSGPVAAGDTSRWIIGRSESGAGPTRRAHILIKPTQTGLATNLLINTDRRTYRLELRTAPRGYMAGVEWRYPEDALIALRVDPAPALAAPLAATATPFDPLSLRFGYRISGPKVAWRPSLAFDDGQRVYVALPPNAAQTQLPPLFVRGPEGGGELVNYRVHNGYMVVDKLFDAAELRMGGKRGAKTVRIDRVQETSR